MPSQKLFDGRLNGYLPGNELNIAASLPLHREESYDVDPVTYEIVRSHLWTINLEHGDTIQRTSGSPTVIYANDFNQSIHTELGEAVVLGPSMLHFTGLADLAIKWTLENRSVSPSIRDGDIFLQNDPWVGAAHQQDLTVYSPVFAGDELFAWVLNVCHERDIGGVEPGSFVPQAKDVFWESTPVPPILIARGDQVLRDVEEMFVRKSRLPETCTFEIRSQIAGVLSAKRRILELIDKYSPGTVKAVMRKAISDCEHVVRLRLASLPDGEWSHRVYYTGSSFGDRTLKRQVLTMKKVGDTLHWNNHGTDAQQGPTNVTVGTWRANIVATVLNHFAYDQYLCAGGVIRVLEFNPTPGLRTSCTWPSAVTGSANPARATAAQANHMISQLIACDESQSRYSWATDGIHTEVFAVFHGIREDGRRVIGGASDLLAGATGGRSFADGISAGGRSLAPMSRTADVEVWEQNLGILYLYRRLQQIGGHGAWVGGSALVSAYIGHGVSDQWSSNNTAGNALPSGPGIGGALPGPGGSLFCAQNTEIRKKMTSGQYPRTSKQLHSLNLNLRMVLPKETQIPFGADDVWEIRYASAAGYGDPLCRQMHLVARDVALGRLDSQLARSIYGVVMKVTGEADEIATTELRESILGDRIAAGRSFDPPLEQSKESGADLRILHPLGPALCHVSVNNSTYYQCARCEWLVAATTENYKRRALMIDLPVTELDPGSFINPASQVDEAIVCRLYVCPGCGHLFDSDLCRPTDEPYWDVKLSVPQLP
jgi:N-methylhydantoinase B